ncbi:LuxR C-terminal-related transcriptional regulator [Micromonospora sp. NBC_00858]|uniref:LuxR C-terminal-related transcriptional regulator n=1 Tax=Micromonospora sp. NBC_00858 TaxID=2975979 RepID=UPI00386D3F3B|nr:LuxR C-terminal-related transcriptional regulator [Micromonospora sp. NBC_00858]
MASPLVETKLYIPKLRHSLVARQRLSERLSRGAESRLTLISAPAGFGKTTLLSAWLASGAEQRSVAWLSLEESDSQPGLFWTYVITALQNVVPGVGAGALPLLQSAQTPIETVLATLLNELSAVPNEIHLVLDDYHLVDGPDVETGMVFLLEHLPPHVHLVISSRADPALPLARLRARGELVEVRAAELRFTLDEVTDYLNEVIGLNLTANDIAALEGRTEGWIAALQLAALSMQGRADVAGFIAGFAGDDRYIVDYLVEEVLRRQSDHVRTFLVQTSILDRLSGPLCDAVTAQHGGKAMLESLDRANLFVVPLDDSRRWYRYHHLFADVLRTHLLDERADEAADLHRRASQWYDQNGEPSPAVRHALAAGDVERAAGLVELAMPALRRNRQDPTIRGWLDAIPDEVVRVRPVLAVGLIGALMSGGEFEGIEDRLRDAEQLLDKPPTDRAEMVVVDEEELLRLPGVIQMYRAALALVRGDTPATIRHAHRAIDRTAVDDHLTRAGASALLGLAFWGNGDLEAAHQAYSACVEGMRRVGHISDVLGCSITLADTRITQGRLGEALRTYEQALQLASHHGGPVLRGMADMYVGMSQIACERNDLDAATQHLRRSQELGEHTGLPQNRYRWRVSMARVLQAQGDLRGALQLLDEAQHVYVGDFSPNVRPVPALTARLLAMQGRIGEALSWAREQGLSVDDDVSYLREFEHVTLARVLLAQYTAHRAGASATEAARLLERLLTAAEAGERTGSVIEILVLQALTHHARGDTPGALAPLERALTLAEPEGYVRVFAGEGPPMVSLLKAVAKQRVSWDYVHRLVNACGHADETPVNQPRRLTQGLVEPLSERELEVLRLLGTDLDGPAIARELVVSLNTLRTHTRNIYAKLGVNSRRAAVRQAGELNLLSRTRER